MICSVPWHIVQFECAIRLACYTLVLLLLVLVMTVSNVYSWLCISGSGVLPTTEPEDCSNSTYGCCPDGTRVATGPNFEGCDVISKNCTVSYFGCCPDGVSPGMNLCVELICMHTYI